MKLQDHLELHLEIEKPNKTAEIYNQKDLVSSNRTPIVTPSANLPRLPEYRIVASHNMETSPQHKISVTPITIQLKIDHMKQERSKLGSVLPLIDGDLSRQVGIASQTPCSR